MLLFGLATFGQKWIRFGTKNGLASKWDGKGENVGIGNVLEIRKVQTEIRLKSISLSKYEPIRCCKYCSQYSFFLLDYTQYALFVRHFLRFAFCCRFFDNERFFTVYLLRVYAFFVKILKMNDKTKAGGVFAKLLGKKLGTII